MARVAGIVAVALAAGAHGRGWDLRDDAGQPVPAGVYLARFTAGGWSRTRRIAVIRRGEES